MQTDFDRKMEAQRRKIRRVNDELRQAPASAPKQRRGFMVYRSERSTTNDGYLDGAARGVGDFLRSGIAWVALGFLGILALEVLRIVVQVIG
jgi:hypothetical protein